MRLRNAKATHEHVRLLQLCEVRTKRLNLILFVSIITTKQTGHLT